MTDLDGKSHLISPFKTKGVREMVWYWWLIGGYLAVALIISVFVIVIAIRSEWETNIRSTKPEKPDYWGFIKNCGDYIGKSIIFGLAWFYCWVIHPLIQKEKEVKGMKQFRTLSYWLVVLFLILMILVVISLILLEEKDILTIFLTVYFGLGIILGIDRHWDKLVAYQMNKEWGLLVLTYFQVMILMGISWVPLFFYFCLMDLKDKIVDEMFAGLGD